jgi:hypothetical protein
MYYVLRGIRRREGPSPPLGVYEALLAVHSRDDYLNIPTKFTYMLI